MMDALLLSAGFGSRLRPLTDLIPKPLIKVGGKPLIAWHLERLERLRVKRVFINTHYLSGLISEYITSNWSNKLQIELIHETVILDTGGAVSNIRERIGESDLIVINSDLFLTEDYDLQDMVSEHNNNNSEVTILVSEACENNFTKLFLDECNYVLDLGEQIGIKTEKIVNFIGVSILSHKFILSLPPHGSSFSLTTLGFLNCIKQNKKGIKAVYYNNFWSDVGTPERLNEVNEYLKI